MVISSKFINIFLGVILCIVTFFCFKQQYQLNKMKDMYLNKLEVVKEDKKNFILTTRSQINELKIKNQLQNEVIINTVKTIDSLQLIKNKIKEVIIQKEKQIKKLNEKQVTDYWRNEFNVKPLIDDKE
jgi:hypothetical protein